MDAQRELAVLRRRLAVAEASAASSRVEADSAWATLAADERQHVEELRQQRLRCYAAAERRGFAAAERQATQLRSELCLLSIEHPIALDTQAQLHQAELAALQQQHAAELAALQQQQHAAALQAAREEERARLRSRVEPALTSLQLRSQQHLERLAAVEQRLGLQEEELVDTRQVVFDLLGEPAATRRRLGM